MACFRAVMTGAVMAGVSALVLADRRALVRYAPVETVLLRDGVTAIEAEGWQGHPSGAVTPPVAAMTRAAMSLPIGAKAPGANVTIRASDRGWTGESDDADRPNVRYRALLSAPLRIEVSGPVLPEAPRRVVTTARIPLLNRDGRFDGYDQVLAVAGRRVRVRRGAYKRAPRTAWRDFADLAVLRSARWRVDELSTDLETEDTAQLLKVPLQTRRYLGTGGGEGTAEMAGRLMPYGLGWQAGVELELCDPASNTYRYGDGSTPRQVLQIADRGAVFTSLGDFASEAALEAVSLAGGQLATCSSENLLRVGGLNSGYQLRATLAPGEGAPSTHAEILEHLWRERAGLRGDEYWPASLATLPPGEAGWQAPSAAEEEGEGPTVEEWVAEFCRSAVADYGDDEAGRLRVWWLTPTRGEPVLSIEQKDPLDRPRPLPELEIPHRETRTTWRERLAPVTELVAAADDPSEADAYQLSEVATANLRTKYPTAGVRLHRSRFYNKADADLQTAHLAEILGPHRLIQVDLGREVYLLSWHSEVRLTRDRLGLAGGLAARVVGLVKDGDRGSAILYARTS